MRSKLTDESLMPFGKYRGEKMGDVPANYLHWYYISGGERKLCQVEAYIEDNLHILKLEFEDGVWEKPNGK